MGDKESKLIGKYFHTFEDGKLCRQGKVVSLEPDGHYFVEIYDCCGGVFEMRLVKFAEMVDWRFYPDIETMEYHTGRWSRSRWG